jgi:hypothetical protein
MKQEKYSGDWSNVQRNAILLIMVTMLIVYIAVPIYGVIQDTKEDGTVFVIEGSGAEAGKDLLDKIIDFAFQTNEVKVQTSFVLDVQGVVITSDKTPYANGIVELRSKPRYTRTDKDGFFIFRSVEAGAHKINVLDEAGNILATCNVDLAVRKTDELVTTSFSDNTYRINVAVNVQVLEIKITLKTDEEGDVEGISSLEVVNVETAPLDEAEDAEPVPPDTDDSQQPEDGSDESDDLPLPPNNGGSGSPGGGGGGGGGTIPPSNPFQFKVYDNSNSSYGSTAAAKVNIFGEDKHISPGMKGSYKFTVDNTRNNYSSQYKINFTHSDNLPAEKKLPIVFRLKKGDAYVEGDEDTWRKINQLHQNTSIAENQKTAYSLEWYWPESEDDDDFSKLDRVTDYSYTLRIEVEAKME